jgi:uncharacterized protein involved in propanediol utilization
LGIEGLTLTLVTEGVPPPPNTVTFAWPYLVVSTADVARTVRAVRVSSDATVRRPASLMVVPDALPDSTMDQVTLWAGLLVPLTVAVNGWVPPLATLGIEGLTVTVSTVGIWLLSAYTVTVAVPDLLGSTVDVARTVRAVRVSSDATVRRPASLMVVPDALPDSTMDQVTVWAGLLVPFTVAVND